MITFTKDEIKKIALMSNLEIHEDELLSLSEQLSAVLSYAQRVQEVTSDVAYSSSKNINVFREDVVVKTDSEAILCQAPEREDNYFVVPAILETSKK